MISVKLQTGLRGGKGLGSLIDTDLPKKAALRFAKTAGTIIKSSIREAISARMIRPTGKLAGSFQVRSKSVSGGLVGLDVRSVGKPARYARIQDQGGIIKPVRAPYLHFKAYSGRWVRTKRVRIPARRYLSFAAAKARPRLAIALAKSIREQAKAGR